MSSQVKGIAAATQLFRSAASSINEGIDLFRSSGARRNGDNGTWARQFLSSRMRLGSAATIAERGADQLGKLGIDSETIAQLKGAADAVRIEANKMHRDVIPEIKKVEDARDLLERVVGELDTRRGNIVVPPAPEGPPARAVEVPTASGTGPEVPVAGSAPEVEKVKAPTAPTPPREAEATG